MAVYAFWSGGSWLKVGHAGPNSSARYTSQHYSPGSGGSTLARSLCGCIELAEKYAIESSNVGGWIKANCCRTNVLLPADKPHELRWLLEAFLHARLRPIFER
jgi:hypothetical protein